MLILIALVIGYVIGLMQKGIKININKDSLPDTTSDEYNASHGIPKFMDYYEQTEGENKF